MTRPRGGGRRRPPPLRAHVLRSVMVTPSLARVTVGGEALAGFNFPGPASHFKLFLPAPGEREVALPEPGADGLVTFDPAAPHIMRTYTARRFDRLTRELDIDLVLHSDGPAAHWAANVAPGDRIALSSPRTAGFTLPTDATWLLLGGDTSAVPAIATILESDLDVETTCLIEISDPAEVIDLPTHGPREVRWSLRDLAAAPGSCLLHHLRSRDRPTTPGFVWIAGEAASIRSRAFQGRASSSVVELGALRASKIRTDYRLVICGTRPRAGHTTLSAPCLVADAL